MRLWKESRTTSWTSSWQPCKPVTTDFKGDTHGRHRSIDGYGIGGRDPFDVEQDVNALAASFSILNEKHTFTPGDIVEWKEGMNNKRSKGLFVVVEVLNEPIVLNQKEGTPVFREPLDIIVGQHDADGDFDLWHLDSRRLRPVSEK